MLMVTLDYFKIMETIMHSFDRAADIVVVVVIIVFSNFIIAGFIIMS